MKIQNRGRIDIIDSFNCRVAKQYYDFGQIRDMLSGNFMSINHHLRWYMLRAILKDMR